MKFRLSQEQRWQRRLRRWEIQGGEGPVLLDTEWGWLVGAWAPNGSTFKAEAMTVRHPSCSWWGRALTQPPQEVWVLALGRPVADAVVYEMAAIGALWLTLMAVLPMWGIIGSFLLATATVLAAASAITVARGRRLRSVSMSSDHGRQVLQLAADVDHATLWKAIVDPDVAEALTHRSELPSYDTTPLVPEGHYEMYNQPPWDTAEPGDG